MYSRHHKDGKFLISFWTPDLQPFITLAVSDMNDTALEKLKPFFSKDSFRARNIFTAVPILTTGISKKRVQTLPNSGSRSLTRMIHDLSTLSLDSSINMENGVDRLLSVFA